MTYLLARVMTAIAILTVLAVPTRLLAAQAPPQYIAIDLGTLGGSNAFLDLPGQPMNARGDIVGQADTATILPGCGCYNDAGFVWSHGVMGGLGQISNGFFGGAFSINNSGSIVGLSYINTIDPALNFPEARSVLWKNGQAIDLGTLPGGDESNAFAVNDQGLIAGPSSNGTPDLYGCQIFICWATQTRGFVWQNGKMTNLGTLGGTCGFANGMNSRGEVVGQSNLGGNQTYHPFLWDGHGMMDLGTLGGPNGFANWISDSGAVAGEADLNPQPDGTVVHHGFLWEKGGRTDLQPVENAPCSLGRAVNNASQVVGDITDCHGDSLAGMLWEKGSAYDLNTLVAPSALHIIHANYISERGEIVGQAVLNGNQRVVLLVPYALAESQGQISNAPPPAPASTTAMRTGSPAQSEENTLYGPLRLWRYHREGE